MIHPPTKTNGPLEDHELAELAELLYDLGAFVAEQAELVPEHLRVRISWWWLRLVDVGDRP